MNKKQIELFESDIYLCRRIEKTRIDSDIITGWIGTAVGVFFIITIPGVIIFREAALPIALFIAVVVASLKASSKLNERKIKLDHLVDRFYQAIDDIRSNRPNSHIIKYRYDFVELEIHDTVEPHKDIKGDDTLATAFAQNFANMDRNYWQITLRTAESLGIPIPDWVYADKKNTNWYH